jgi:prephenate dehydrogenase
MAGSHRSGFVAARADLFDEAPYFLVPPGAGVHPGAYDQVATTVRWIGARPIEVDPSGHDRDVAVTSHLPQMVAWALDAVVREAAPTLPGGSGLRDMTRLAGSDWNLWTDVLAATGDLAVGPLDEMIFRLTAARDALAAGSPGRLREALTSTQCDVAVG